MFEWTSTHETYFNMKLRSAIAKNMVAGPEDIEELKYAISGLKEDNEKLKEKIKRLEMKIENK